MSRGKRRYPLGVPFERAKGTKTRLGRSPLRTSLGVRGWECVQPRFGPSLLLWLLSLPPHQGTLGNWPYGWVVSTSGLLWRSGVPAAGSLASDRWEQRLTRVRP